MNDKTASERLPKPFLSFIVRVGICVVVMIGAVVAADSDSLSGGEHRSEDYSEKCRGDDGKEKLPLFYSHVLVKGLHQQVKFYLQYSKHSLYPFILLSCLTSRPAKRSRLQQQKILEIILSLYVEASSSFERFVLIIIGFPVFMRVLIML